MPLTPHAVEVSPTSWILPNRVQFPVWMTETFSYSATPADVRGLYVHQRFVRDYLQPASPYRGLLLYHGLGVGKTCASIAVADVLRPPSSSEKNSMKVFVMLPAFLRGNFVQEVRRCGDPRFLPGQTWTARTARRGHTFEATPDTQGGTPFADFSPEDRDAILAQIDRDILSAYTVVHYNGLTAKSVAELCREGDEETNPFDDAVIIIDEAPNMISQVMHNKMMARVYQRIMDADRCKVVLLSGTPLVNAPRELAYISNLTHGYIHELMFSGIPSGVDVPALEASLLLHPSVDHVSSQILVDGSRVTLTLLPSGFVRQEEGGVAVVPSADAPRPAALIRSLHELATSIAGVELREPTRQDRFLLPIDDETFSSAFLSSTTPSFSEDPPVPVQVMNAELLARRLLGTVSVYSSTDPALMPTIHPATVVRVPMSDRQFEEYLVQRDIERRKERAAARFATLNGGETSTNLYRAFSRAVCTFVFPDGIRRPYRSDANRATELEDEDGDDDDGATAAPDGGTLVRRRADRLYDEGLDAALALVYADRAKLLTVGGDLPTLSPKYASILAHLMEPANARKPAIIYSQFRRVEGLGLLRMTLIANGFAELRVVTRRGALVAEVFPVDAKADAPRFIIYGNDDAPAAVAMLKIFNSQLGELPSSLATSLASLVQVQEEDGNRHGAVARLLLITQSGSEGISTRNVREVHVIEPFWHANRILQVVGRAARANSHIDLPQPEKVVDVFVYAATFTEFQASNRTITKLDKKRTSDEHILVVATRKRVLLDRFTDVLRRAAVDCVLHHPVSAARRCFVHTPATLKRGDGALSFHTDLRLDIATQGRNVRLIPFLLEDGRPGLADPATGDVYDRATHAKTGRFRRIAQRRPASVAERMRGSISARAAA